MSQLVAGVPAIVKYKHFDETHLAFPIASRDLKTHIGANDEPLLSLVIVKPVLNPVSKETVSVSGTSREGELVQILHDVPHETTENKNLPGGRWLELSSDELDDLAIEAEQRERGLAVRAAQAKEEAEKKATEEEQAKAAQAATPAPAPTGHAELAQAAADLKEATANLAKASAAQTTPTPKAPEPPAGGDGGGTVQ